MVSSKDLVVAQGHDAETVAAEATVLVDNGKWQVCKGGKGLERVFKFKTFKATWEFMNHVAAECKTQKHHPEWTNIYNKTHIRWTTHNPEGLSSKDTAMARFCDETGEQVGELPAERMDAEVDGEGRMTVGDCCTPKKKPEG